MHFMIDVIDRDRVMMNKFTNYHYCSFTGTMQQIPDVYMRLPILRYESSLSRYYTSSVIVVHFS
jgi:hypothetical protein